MSKFAVIEFGCSEAFASWGEHTRRVKICGGLATLEFRKRPKSQV